MSFLGKDILKNASTAFMIFGAIDAVLSIIGMFSFFGFLISYFIIALVASLLYIGVGYIGSKKWSDPSQFNYFIITGGILCAIGLINLLSRFEATSFIGFVLPGLYIYGGLQLKNAK